MNGKVVVVTGATSGIGEVCALELARMGATVVLISRSQSKLDDVVKRIKDETGNQAVSGIQADLSVIAEIRQAAASFLARHSRLDVLVNNAGAVNWQRLESADGYEMTFALNHLNYFLLTHLLLDTLKETAEKYGEARIINVSSEAHQGSSINFEDIQSLQRYTSFEVYGKSKLMNILFTNELARRLKGTDVTTNSLHPGFVKTNFGRNSSGYIKWIMTMLQNFFAISVEKGAETMVYLASSPDVKGISGKYWDKKTAVQAYKTAYDEVAQAKLWRVSEELVGLPVTV
jgi:NAD(P)-dependent dehydrogenase (short-subunit alcohol dehydrogenase family)